MSANSYPPLQLNGFNELLQSVYACFETILSLLRKEYELGTPCTRTDLLQSTYRLAKETYLEMRHEAILQKKDILDGLFTRDSFVEGTQAVARPVIMNSTQHLRLRHWSEKLEGVVEHAQDQVNAINKHRSWYQVVWESVRDFVNRSLCCFTKQPKISSCGLLSQVVKDNQERAVELRGHAFLFNQTADGFSDQSAIDREHQVSPVTLT